MTSDKPKNTAVAVKKATVPALVERSSVPVASHYNEYKQYLRPDFFYSCAYCTMSEAEAMAIRFVIDHYEPRKARPDLEHLYSNLMYCCDECNTRKGDRCPPADARADGHRFYRPDEDVYSDHFELAGIRLQPKTKVGDYSIEAIDLNRTALRKLREIRRRLTECEPLVAEGVRGLRDYQIDRLPPHVRGAALSAIKGAETLAKKLAENIDGLLQDYARSDLIEPSPDDKERAKARLAKLKSTAALYPGMWRAPRKPRKPRRGQT